jgi:hypothetical protein
MAPRKKVHASVGQKQRAYEERLKYEGKKRICAWVDKGAAAALKTMAQDEGKAIGEMLEDLIASRP